MKGFRKISFFILLLVVFFPGITKSQCDTVNLGPDTTLCVGETLLLDAGEGFHYYFWNDSTTEQFLSVNDTGTYWCEGVFLDSTNLVYNGDFSLGNTGFSTDYVVGTGGPWGLLSEEGTYFVGINAALTHVNFSPCTDHTTGEGLYMIVNGDSAVNENVWCQPVPVEPNTEYLFSGWFTSVNPVAPAILSYFINGEVVQEVNLTNNTCYWENFVVEWNSGANTQANICILNQNTTLGGNDFGIDDIFLRRICRSVDSINVSFNPGPEFELGNDTTLCEGEELELMAEGGESYLWSNGSVDSSIIVNLPGTFWVEVTNEYGCVGIDTINVDFAPIPEMSLGNDTIMCPNSVILLNPGEFVSYFWNDDSEEPVYEATEPGEYWVSVIDENGCSASDTILIDPAPPVNPDLGDDITICNGDAYTLNPGSFTSYYWQNGSTASSLEVNQAGEYWVEVTDENTCSGSDTVQIYVSPAPEINLGEDTTLCLGASLELDAGSGMASYLWQDNSTSSTFYVYESGYYSVVVTNYFDCESSDDIIVDYSNPDISLGPDTSMCYHDSIYLSPGDEFASYLWQDGSTNSSYHVTTSGYYSVNIVDVFGCEDNDQVELSLLSIPEADLGEDQQLCSGETITLEAPVGPYTYLWNGEEGTATYQVSQGGDYTLQMVNICGDVTDDIYVTEIETPDPYLGEDMVLFPDETIELDAGAGYDTYLWQNGSTSQFYNIIANDLDNEYPGYSVEVTNGPCIGSHTIEVLLFKVEMPNVITPNGDSMNDYFLPMPGSFQGVTSHYISIFNRWGEKIWESENMEEGWDGKRDGKIVADGTYFWILEVFYGPENIKQVQKGTVTVLGTNI